MQQKQERPLSPREQKRKLAREQVKNAPGGKVLLPGGAGGRGKKFHKLANFENIKKKFEALGRLDMQDFNNAQEIGMFLDWYNQGVTEANRKRGEQDITEISKFLARTLGRTTIVIGDKPKK